MAGLVKKGDTKVERTDVFDRFDRMFDDWMRVLPLRRPGVLARQWMAEDMIRVDEFRENGNLVIRAEVPGIDPDKDVELTVSDGLLRIDAERREEETEEKKGYERHELRYGSFSRTLPLPEGVSEKDIKATYKDGILEIRVPSPEPKPVVATKIPIAKT